MKHIIVHPEMGIYLGHCLGLGFWSKLDAAGQNCACTFESVEEASFHIQSWEANGDPALYTLPALKTSGPDGYATISDLKSAGFGDKLGEMVRPAHDAPASVTEITCSGPGM